MFADTTRPASSLLLFPSGPYLQSILHLTSSLLNLSFFPSTPSPSLLCGSPLLSSLTIRAFSPSPVPPHVSPPHALPIYSRIQSIFIDSVVPPPSTFHSLSRSSSLLSSSLPSPSIIFFPFSFLTLHSSLLCSSLSSPPSPPESESLFSLPSDLVACPIYLLFISFTPSLHSGLMASLPSPHATIIHLRSVGRYGAACIKKG